MPIRSPRGRAAAYRGLWQWPLRSPARLAITAGAVLAVAIAVSTALGAVADDPTGPVAAVAPGSTQPQTTRSADAPSSTRTPTPTALPPVPDLTPTTLPVASAPPEALDVAARWSAAWVRPAEGTTAEQWIAGLRPTTSEEYLAVLLSTVDPANIPATQVTGEPRAVVVSPRSVQVEVPTDTLTLQVLVTDTPDDGWRVSGHDRA